MAERAWQGQSRGGRLGHRIVATVARCGHLPVYAFLCFPVAWFLLFEGQARKDLDAYWRRVRPDLGRWGRLVMVTLQFHDFARSLADRFLEGASEGGAFRQTDIGLEPMLDAMNSDKGCILLSAHLGNWELSGRWLVKYPGQKIHIVMLGGEDPRVQAEVAKAMGDHPFTIIDLADPMVASLAITAALQAGETCCMLGDRMAGDQRQHQRVPFFGDTAAFPIGPFIAAMVTGAYVVPCFTIKKGLRDYTMISLTPFRLIPRHRRDRKRVLVRVIGHWARMVEGVARRYPQQWHNFFDFWKT